MAVTRGSGRSHPRQVTRRKPKPKKKKVVKPVITKTPRVKVNKSIGKRNKKSLRSNVRTLKKSTPRRRRRAARVKGGRKSARRKR